MKCNEINIRDPFVLCEAGIYYMYGTRAANFGMQVGGFDVYTSKDLENWDGPTACFDSAGWNLNRGVNWAPEVHKYRGSYYMFATFTKEDGLRGTYVLRSDSLKGPFVPHGDAALTPEGWECLDGTLYIAKDGVPYLVFCHEHTQIIDGTICYVRLSPDLTRTISEPVKIFAASQCPYAQPLRPELHWITDGPFLYRTKEDALLMIWSTFIRDKYAQCLVRFADGELGVAHEHLPPLITGDGGHGMIFKAGDRLMMTYHVPNTTGQEHPCFVVLTNTAEAVVHDDS